MCGDIHGQYYDLLNIFELNGLPSPSNPYVSLESFFSFYLTLLYTVLNCVGVVQPVNREVMTSYSCLSVLKPHP